MAVRSPDVTLKFALANGPVVPTEEPKLNDDLNRHIALECEGSPEFKAAYQAEVERLALIRARQAANVSQVEVVVAESKRNGAGHST